MVPTRNPNSLSIVKSCRILVIKLGYIFIFIRLPYVIIFVNILLYFLSLSHPYMHCTFPKSLQAQFAETIFVRGLSWIRQNVVYAHHQLESLAIRTQVPKVGQSRSVRVKVIVWLEIMYHHCLKSLIRISPELLV